MKTALITGVTGQDGSFLTEWLLKKDYHVIGLTRSPSRTIPFLDKKMAEKITLHTGDLVHSNILEKLITDTQPDEIYHLASQSRPGESWQQAQETLQANGVGTLNLLEAVRKNSPHTKIYHASSSEMYGRTLTAPQNEQTTFEPINPYAAAKLLSHHLARIYRESYGLYIASGILFNHESERRPLHFVTQKVAYGAACAALRITHSPALNERGAPIVYLGQLALGNLDIARDWGYAKDFVHAMWLMLQHPTPEELVIGTGKLHTLRELCDIAYRYVGLSWTDHVISDPSLTRPLETHQTVADPTKAAQLLGWKPSIPFNIMIEKMVQFQIDRLRPLVE